MKTRNGRREESYTIKEVQKILIKTKEGRKGEREGGRKGERKAGSLLGTGVSQPI